MFTKEHFEKVASVLSASRNGITRTNTATVFTAEHAQALVDKLAESFADIFAESNERFSRKAFIGACNAKSRSEIRRLVQANNKRNEPTPLQIALRDV